MVSYIRALLEHQPYDRYVEPFLGGGAVFFGLRPANAVLSDVNTDLIQTYQQVQTQPQELIKRLKQYPVDAETYARLRADVPTDPVDAAARFLYLNRTGFGGMYRLNRDGRFNVPFGGGQRTAEPLWRDGLLLDAAQALQRAELRTNDFESVLADAEQGDLVYCDPTYTIAHNNNGFIRYNERNFSWEDQQRLARVAVDASQRGALVLVSNAVHAEIVHIYPNARVHVVPRWSGLCPDPAARRQTQELLLVLAPSRKKRRYFGPPTPEIRRIRIGAHPSRRRVRAPERWTGGAIRELRASLGLTQKAFAKQLSVSTSAVSGWETSVHAPRSSTERALDCLARMCSGRRIGPSEV